MVNAGLGYGPVPPELTVRPDIIPPGFAPPIPEPATFINVVQLIKALGQRDFQGEISPFLFRTSQFPSPGIKLRVPPGHSTIKRANVIWGLNVAIHHMYLTQHDSTTFPASHYTLLWHDEEIGGLGFGLAANQNEAMGDITAMENRSKTDSAIVTRDISGVVNLTTDVTNNRLSVQYRLLGPLLEKVDLYFALLWVLAVASVPASDTRITRTWILPWLDGLEFHTTFQASPALRTTPPFMTYFWLLEAVAGAAEYLVARNRYGALRMQLKVDGASIGQGVFRHRPVQSE
ncbi:MAG: hypothetical protein Q9226_008495 [Calogaya cf. arnoldii]